MSDFQQKFQQNDRYGTFLLMQLYVCDPLLTKKDSIERSAPRMLEWKQDVTARSLDAIGRWTSPVELRERGLCGLLLVRLGWLQTLRRGGFDGELGLTAPKGG